jgi:hypothetical protein
MNYIGHLRLVALFCCIAVPPVVAQSPRDSAVAQALATFSTGEAIRFSLQGVRYAGPFVSQRGDTLFLGKVDGPPMAIRFNAIDTLWRGTPATGRGAVVGALTLGALGALSSAVTAPILDPGGDHTATVAGATAGGVLTGAAIGALVGSQLRRWRRAYP